MPVTERNPKTTDERIRLRTVEPTPEQEREELLRTETSPSGAIHQEGSKLDKLQPRDVLSLQRMAGNRATAQTLQRKPVSAKIQVNGSVRPIIQRTLNLQDTDWAQTTAITWQKDPTYNAQDIQDRGVVICLSSGGSNLWVKTQEDVSAAVTSQKLIEASGQSLSDDYQSKRTKTKNRWAIATPNIRPTTAADRTGIADAIQRGPVRGPGQSVTDPPPSADRLKPAANRADLIRRGQGGFLACFSQAAGLTNQNI